MTLADVLSHLISSDYDRTCFAESIQEAMIEAYRQEDGHEAIWSGVILAACIDLKGEFSVKPHHDSTLGDAAC